MLSKVFSLEKTNVSHRRWKMAVVLDHTIIPVRDQQEAVAFYTAILGVKDGGCVGPFAVVRVNDTLTLDFIEADPEPSRHYAFAMDADEFEAAFRRIQAAGIPYGDGPFDASNRRGPGVTAGARGQGKAVYFHDPSGHLLEIKTY
jgi:catechol 2,3-dioxygenase-like lactoylglutathione lyase family enzyme